jgi:hypothetical protein
MSIVPGIRAILVCVVSAAWLPLAAAPSPELVVEAPPGLEAVAKEVRTIGNGDFTDVLQLTGITGFTKPIRVILEPESGALARSTASWVSGFADGREATIVLFPARVRSYPDRNLRTLVHHEVAHVLVAQAAGGRPVPRWFNEGVATVAAREWGLEDRARFAMAVVGGRPKSTRDLDAGFSGSGDDVTRAYALSAAFVRFMRREYGSTTPAVVLAGLARGLDFETAFYRATGAGLPRAEMVFFEDQAFWNTWVPFLTSTGALWMAITALALLAFYRRRERNRRLHAVWESESTGSWQGRVVHPDRDEPVN